VAGFGGNERPEWVEVVRKRPVCVIAPFQRARKRLVMLLRRYMRLLDVIELIVVLSNVAL